MNRLLTPLLILSLSVPLVHGDPAIHLKPGFYAGDDPRLKTLSALRKKADLHINLSWHAGISIGDESNLTLKQLKKAVGKMEKKALASVMLEKNYTDQKLHLDVEKVLLESGFKAVLIVGAHSSGMNLEKYSVRNGKKEPGKSKPRSKKHEGEKSSSPERQ
jgi:hypothetical protein